jgi:hypothetical protein
MLAYKWQGATLAFICKAKQNKTKHITKPQHSPWFSITTIPIKSRHQQDQTQQ